ncbi:TetR/AcrR family transcriptional regulator [Millisia brevis]|uniref:TetR/AcrR family transcriptional regulator n=1 Tax=Millisia brevis TaxID=264148 RepID=UPI000A02920A|nr:TetR/AcrR family transcriptional regulator [Millisia brevis]
MSTSPESTSRYHRGNVRQDTLAGARRMLDRMPADKISLREVAREIGISHAAPYRHFPDREEFIRALAAYCLTEWTNEQREGLAKAQTSDARLLSLGETYVGWAARNPYAFRLVFDPAIAATTEPGELRAAMDAHGDLLTSVVGELGAQGRLPRSGSAHIGLALWSTVHGLAQLVTLGQADVSAVPGVLDSLTHSWSR